MLFRSDFLRRHCPDIDSKIGPGIFVNNNGATLGKHKGYPYYTIGQRKGLEIALGYPAYVLRINAEKNTVVLGGVDDLKAGYMLLEDYNMADFEELQSVENLRVRIRYRSKPILCKVFKIDDKNLVVKFLEEASALTPGQSAVFYDDRRVLGGAFIASQKGIQKIIIENKIN